MDNVSTVDKDSMQRKLLISSLIHCAGLKLLETELKSYVESVEIQQKSLQEKPCGDLASINYLNGRQQGYKDLNYILDGFREELEAFADGR